MITCLIRVERGAEALGATLASLVPGVVAGLLGDAVVLVREPGADLERVVESAGARLHLLGAGEEPWKAGARLARANWLLCLSDGDVPGEGWTGSLERFVARAQAGERHARLRRERGWRERIVLWGPARRRLMPGDLVHRQVALGQERAAGPAILTAAIYREPGIG